MFDKPVIVRYAGEKERCHLFLCFPSNENYKNLLDLDNYVRNKNCFSPLLIMDNKTIGIHCIIPKRILEGIEFEKQKSYAVRFELRKNTKDNSKIYYSLVCVEAEYRPDVAIESVEFIN